MSEDPEIFPSLALPDELPPPAPQSRRIPNFGHTVLFFIVAVIVMLFTSVSVFALAMGFHWFGSETSEQLLREPRLLIPAMAVGYLIAGTIVWAIFVNLWRQPLGAALHWNFAVVSRRWPSLLVGGIVLSLVVQFLSNFLPVPKSLPIDDFFRTSADVWMVALFGTFMAPLFEELAFRGFLLPSLASTWDWLRGRKDDVSPADVSSKRDPRWSAAALAVSCTLTSIGFALVHSDQLAHAWAPLAVLFAVSLVLCFVRLWTNSLAASTMIHATYNGTIFTIVFFVTGGFRHLDKIT
ncbi:MAG: type II CAAX endopeptidase family protein [Acidobacteriaceae bacterium]